MSLKVFLVEDSAPIRNRLRRRFARIPGVVVVGEARCLEGLIEALADARPDVVLLDIRLPDGAGLAAVTAIQHLSPSPQIFIVSSHGEEPYRIRARELQVNGFFHKASELEALDEVLLRLAGDSGGEPESV